MKFKLLLSFLLISIFGFTQTVDVNGIIKDSKSGIPIAGINVKVKGSTLSTSTDFDGSFQFYKISKGSVLQFSFIGYRSFEVTVNSNEKLNLKMTEDKNSLDEIVVLGYSSKKKKDVTGSVAVLSSKTIEQLKPIKVEQALQGTIAGVNVTAQSGAPGARLNIKIRGVASNIKTDATVLIDGSLGDLTVLNPDDIESITVLKDAQAAIYGTIGANGIVLVTTKQGKKNSKTRVSVNSYLGIQETTKKLDLLNAREYKLLLNESYANGGQPIPFPIVSNTGTDTNWQNEIFKTAFIANHDFNISGGSDKITYSLSGSDMKQDGIVGGEKSGFKRNTARIALGADITNKFKIQTNFIYTFLKSSGVNDNGLGSVLFNAVNSPSILPVFDTNGNYTLIPSSTGYGIELINPMAQIDNTHNEYVLRKLTGNVKLTYDLTKDLKFTARVGFNSGNSISKNFSKKISYGGKVFDVPRSRVNQNTTNDNDFTFDFFGDYEKNFLENHKIKFTVGMTSYKEFGSGLFATGYEIPNNSYEFADINLATGLGTGNDNSAYAFDERRFSQFAFLDYDFKGKYLISGTLRRDLSTKFGADKRAGIFPAVTAGWIVSDESFIKKTKFFNFLKIRGSYGILGNDQIGNNRYIGSLNGEGVYVTNENILKGTAIGVLPNPKIQWEEAEKFDLGFDLKVLNNKIEINADYFNERRNNLLVERVPVSGIVGVYAPGGGSPTVNAGTVNNKGFEFAINYKDKFLENFNFSLGFNITKLTNIVLEVNNPEKYIEGGGFGVSQPASTRMEEGYALGYFYGYKSDGIFQNQAEIDAHPSQTALGSNITSPGDIRYKDMNGDGVIDLKDKTDVGSSIPDYNLGFNLNLNYKNLDFIAYSYASIGNDMVRNYERALSDVNKLNYVLDRWTGEGTSNTVPRVSVGPNNNFVLSDYFVEDASFFRIQNIQLGYTVNQKVVEKIGLSKLRFYTTINNVYTFTKYKGFDPAASSGSSPDRPGESTLGFGVDNGFYPTPRIYMFGINLIF